MFNIDDLYSVSSGVKVFNYWNPFVTKHDTSSFYNWEQDNLPLYDLEERTHYIWEKLGFPLSGVPGMAYIVSATVPDTAGSANIFTSVSAAIEALPEIIRMPTLIEVAVAGDMGELNLNNIKCEGDGVLEIVNRAFAPISDNNYDMYMQRYPNSAGQAYFPNTLSGAHGGFFGTLSSTSALSMSSNTSSLIKWAAGTGSECRNLILAGKGTSATNWEDIGGYSYPGANNNSVAYKIQSGANLFLKANPISYVASIPESAVVADTTIKDYDLSTIRDDTGAETYPSQYTAGQLAKGVWAGNWFSKVKAQNCDGPIYIRGFIVDGANSTTKGIGAYNCHNLTLENCGAMRCTTAGFDIQNSNINLRRQAIASRNYNSTDRGTLTTYGFKATNSDITFVTDSYASGVKATLASHFHDYGIYLDNSILHGGDIIDNQQMISSFYTDIGFNNTGLYCSNSKYSMDGVTTSYNNRINIEANDSVLEVEQLRSCNAQHYGLLMNNSKFRYNKNLNTSAVGRATTSQNSTYPKEHNYPILFYYNGQHVVLQGGSTYGPTYPVGTSGIDITHYYNQEIYYVNHGRAYGTTASGAAKPGVVVDNSIGEFTCAKFISGAIKHQDTSVPRHLLSTNNGTATVRGLTNIDDGNNTVCYFDGPKQTFCAAAIADNNSVINFTGPVAMYNHGYGAIASNNSLIRVSPPMDESGSYVGTGKAANDPLGTSGWGGGTHKATPVMEIHCQGAALVADKSSSLVLEELGYSPTHWLGDEGDSNIDSYMGEASFINLVTSGALQFYPNRATNAAGMSYPMAGDGESTAGGDTFIGTSVATNREYTNYLQKDTTLSCYRVLYQGNGAGYGDAGISTNIQQISTGGMCVRATNDSFVKVRNVHFPMGHRASNESFYDASSDLAGCAQLLMWNIADTSELDAAYCLVSGVYPSLAGYTGPRAVHTPSGVTDAAYEHWGSQDGSGMLSGMPSGTPDTGIISVLDHYGSGVHFTQDFDQRLHGLSAFMSSIGTSRTGITTSGSYGPVGYQNRGPFRLYFSVLPAAKTLSYVSSDGGGWGPGINTADNAPYQHLSQGYLLSGNCSGPADFSGLYPQLLNDHLFSVSSILATSGYYYPSAMMPDERATVWLDESAANTFANAKHCNTDYSGRIKLVNIYRARTDVHSESHIGNSRGHGFGFRTSNVFDSKRRT